MVEERTKNTLYDLDLWVKVTQNVVKCPPNQMTFAHAKFEIAASINFYKKVHSLTFDLDLGVKATQMLLSILYIMWPIHLQGLMLLHLTVKEEMHLQEITLFDLSRSHKMLPSTLYIM